ncbi:MAG: NUDIX hydrolase [Oscillospiraceae bacterium]|nr:NUDIX hydrolase [Oscillospiraceae bacterium]MBQ5412579.1 NUDIX hydrolase [Oscillospiraceae bacterium]
MSGQREKVLQTVRSYIPKSDREAADRMQILNYLESGRDALTRDDTVAHFTASAWVTDPDRSRVLMAYHNIYRSWAWLGGHADGDGDLAAVAFREATEETGIDRPVQLCGGPVSLEVLNVAAHIKNSAIVSPHLHFNLTYLFEADPSLPLKIKQDENSAVGWRTEAQITAETEEAQIIPIYKKLLSIMKQY